MQFQPLILILWTSNWLVVKMNKKFYMLTTYGLQPNEHSIGLVNAAFAVDVLFEKA